MTTARPGRRFTAVAIFMLIAAAWIGVGLPRLQVGSGVDSYLPASDASVTALKTMANSFGGDPVVVMLESTKADSLLDENHLPNLLHLEGLLAALPDVAVTYGPATTLNQTVLRIKEMLANLSGERDALSEAGKTAELKSFNERYGSLVVRSLPGGLPTLRNPTFVARVLYGAGTVVRPSWSQFVPSHRAVVIYVRPRNGLDQKSAEALTDNVVRAVRSVDTGASRVTVTGAPAVTAELGSTARSELPKLGLAALAAVALVLLIFPWTRRSRRLAPMVPMTLATLLTLATFGLRGTPVSLGAVAFLPVILGVGSYYPVYLAQREHRRLVLAVAGAAAAAFATLTFSPLPFVRDLGTAIALGIGFVVLVSLVLSLVVTPAASPHPVVVPQRYPDVEVTKPGRREIRKAGFALLAVLACIGWVVLPKIPIQTDPQRLIAGLPGFDQATHVEDVLGFSGEVDVILHGPDVLSPAGRTWFRQAENGIVLQYGNRVRPLVSPTDLLSFLGTSPTPGQVDAAMELLPSYVSGAAVTSDRTRGVISLGGDWQALNDKTDVIAGIEHRLPPAPPGYTASVTGLPVAAARGYDLVSSSRYAANILGVLAAAGVLAVALRRRRDALLALLSAAIATGLGVFTIWLTGTALNPLTLALGPLTAAAGCEFAVLLVTARRTGDESLRRSVYLASSLSVAGYGVLLLSGLEVVRQFGMTLVGAVALALLSATAVAQLVRPVRPPTEPAVEMEAVRSLEEVGV
ncbi:MAG: hypothetical protein JWP74_3176 [Marmoricola sp.]|nr:hypothetical protein [Marmoricola sp.]